MQAALELTSPQQPHDGPGPATEGRRVRPRLGDGGGSCAHALEAAAAAAEPGAAGPAAEGEADWSRPLRDVFEPVLSLLPPRCLLHAALTCRGWAAVAAHSLGGRRRAQARDRWAEAAQAVPRMAWALAEAEAGAEELGRLAELGSPPAPLSQLFWALEVLWSQCQDRLGRWGRGKEEFVAALKHLWEARGSALEAEGQGPPDSESADDPEGGAWRVDDPSWRHSRWEAARALMRSPDFPLPGLRMALPLGPRTLARLRSRTGGAGGPGPQPPPLVAEEVAAHSKAAGSLAEWLLGARELSRAALEAEAAHAWDWPQRLVRRSTAEGQAGAGLSLAAAAAGPASKVEWMILTGRKIVVRKQQLAEYVVTIRNELKFLDAAVVTAMPRAPRLPPLPPGCSTGTALAAAEAWAQALATAEAQPAAEGQAQQALPEPPARNAQRRKLTETQRTCASKAAAMQAALELTSPQQPHDGPATEGRRVRPRLGDRGGSCAHALEAAAAAAEPGAAGPAAEGEADWSRPLRDEFEPVLSLLPPRCLLHAALTCRGWAAVAAHSLGGRRRAQARDRWAEAAQAIPQTAWALAEAGAGAEELGRLAEIKSPPAPLSQLFWALEVLWPQCQDRLGRWGRGEEELEAAQRHLWQSSGPALEAEVQGPPDSESADDSEGGAWRVDDPSWRHSRWEAARALMQSPDFPLPGLRMALPLGPRTLARLRSRTGGAGGPGPQPPPLVAEEVAAHSKAAGRLAEWLLGARELSRAALEAEAAHAWDWPQRLVRRSTGGQAGAAGTSAAAAPASGSAGLVRGGHELLLRKQMLAEQVGKLVGALNMIGAAVMSRMPLAPRLPPLSPGRTAGATVAAAAAWAQALTAAAGQGVAEDQAQAVGALLGLLPGCVECLHKSVEIEQRVAEVWAQQMKGLGIADRHRVRPRLGDGGGSCAHALEAAAAAAEPGAAGPAAGGEADWSRPPRDEFEPVLSLLPPRCLLHAALTCRGWAAVAAHSLGGRRRAQARDRWAEAAQAIPQTAWALAEAGAGAEELGRLAELESPPATLFQLFWALELLWPRCQERLGRWGRGMEEMDAALKHLWQAGGSALEAEGQDPPDIESADDSEDGAWRVDDPSWRHSRWEAARALMRSPDFPCPGLRMALPLGPRTLARLRSRSGGAGGPGPQPPPLVAEEVAAHSKAAGRLAEWLLGARELSRAALEAEAAHAWDWPQRLVRRSTGGQAGAGPTTAAALLGATASVVRILLSKGRTLVATQQELEQCMVTMKAGLMRGDAAVARELPLAPRLPPLPTRCSTVQALAAAEAWAQALAAAQQQAAAGQQAAAAEEAEAAELLLSRVRELVACLRKNVELEQGLAEAWELVMKGLRVVEPMQAALELTRPQQPHDGSGPATEGRRVRPRLGDGGGSCAHALEAAAAAAEPGAAGPGDGEADWSRPPRDEFEPVLSLLPPRCLLHAALTCRGWAAVAAHSLGGRRRAQARDRWAEAARAIPRLAQALAEAGEGAEELGRLAELESPPATLFQLFWALELLWPPMQAALELTRPQQPHDGSGPATEGRRVRPRLGDGGGSCAHALEAAAAAAEPGAAGPGDGEADWSRPPRDEFEPVLSLLPPRCLLHAALTCRGWAAVAAHSLGGRRRAQARDRWAEAARAIPRLAQALAEAGEGAEELGRLAELESPPATLFQLFWALELLWPRCQERLGRWGRGMEEMDAALKHLWQAGGSALEAEGQDPPDIESADDSEDGAWRVDDPSWRHSRWEAARALMRSPDFPCPGLRMALPLGPRTLARLRSRSGGAGGPGPQPPPLVAEEVAAHSKAAGRLAEWLLGARELSRAALEAEAAHAWDWPQRLVRRSTGGQAGAGPTTAAALLGATASVVEILLSKGRTLVATQQELEQCMVTIKAGLMRGDAAVARELPLAPRLPPLPTRCSTVQALAAAEAWAQALAAAQQQAAAEGQAAAGQQAAAEEEAEAAELLLGRVRELVACLRKNVELEQGLAEAWELVMKGLRVVEPLYFAEIELAHQRRQVQAMQAALELTSPQQPHDGPGPATEGRRVRPRLGDGGGSCAHALEAAAAAAEPRAAGSGEGEADWSRPPRDEFEPVLSLLPPRCLLHAALTCRGWAAVAAHSLGGRRRAQARDRWAEAAQAIPHLTWALAEAGAGAEELKSLLEMESPPAPLSQLFWALEVLWPQCQDRLGRWGREMDEIEAAQQHLWEAGGPALEAEDVGPPGADDPEGGAWRVDDPSWRHSRWEAARALMRSPDFPCPGLRMALPLGPRTLARLRSRTGGAGGPGPQPPPLVAEEVAAHSKAAGSLAEWLLGARELSRAALEAEAAHAWDWPQRLVRRSTEGQAGAAGTSAAAALLNEAASFVRILLSKGRTLVATQQELAQCLVKVKADLLRGDAAVARVVPLAPRLPPLPPRCSAVQALAAAEAWAQALTAVVAAAQAQAAAEAWAQAPAAAEGQVAAAAAAQAAELLLGSVREGVTCLRKYIISEGHGAEAWEKLMKRLGMADRYLL
ncbi:hypothetical protein HYH03_013989 [Edaphochlamys debaryana]|uniref:F-box domain-containing protein n=1 Tax=Edaphochlamys debaryana TaxID=47281 RepID=A0A836BSE9_9CHLO|nr:hypothetical protein HYH03_013989 [Edaphochlamys debaryana]|eukprot:KAG2487421.1 hypothetical protein HYH03_013989 [Edaphochlamys debaryana]